MTRPHPTARAEDLEARQFLAGVLDRSFASGGHALVGAKSARAVQVQSDDKLLVAGGSDANGDSRLVRLTPAGALDSSFGTGGGSTTDFVGRAGTAKDVFRSRTSSVEGGDSCEARR